jgi:hypothetical protein
VSRSIFGLATSRGEHSLFVLVHIPQQCEFVSFVSVAWEVMTHSTQYYYFDSCTMSCLLCLKVNLYNSVCNIIFSMKSCGIITTVVIACFTISTLSYHCNQYCESV